MLERLSRLYSENRITIHGLIKAVKDYLWITEKEYKNITGFVYPNTEYVDDNISVKEDNIFDTQ